MADTDKLTTSDIAAESKPANQDRNGEPEETKPTFNPPPRPDDKAKADPAVASTSSRPPSDDERDAAASAAAGTAGNGKTELLERDEAEDLRRKWTDIQTTFVDRPKDSVSQADELVAETIKRLAEGFAEERDNLEGVWSQGGDVSTEDLRVALQRYRSFFERLLNA